MAGRGSEVNGKKGGSSPTFGVLLLTRTLSSISQAVMAWGVCAPLKKKINCIHLILNFPGVKSNI